MTSVTRILAVPLLVLLVAASAAAAAPPPRTVHLYGDSIMKGWGWGHYDDPSFLGRIDLIATRLARANGSALRFNRTTVQAPARICMAVKAGEIRRADRVVFEDAGPRETSGAARQRWLEHVARCATRHRGRTAGRLVAPPARLLLSTMFDYDPNPVTVPNSTYDAPLDDGRTANLITSQVARRYGAGLLDWNRIMDDRRGRLPELRLVHPDGIHPTVFGNVVMAATLLQQEGVRLRNVGPLVDELLREHDRLVAYGMAPPFDRATATAWVRVLTG